MARKPQARTVRKLIEQFIQDQEKVWIDQDEGVMGYKAGKTPVSEDLIIDYDNKMETRHTEVGYLAERVPKKSKTEPYALILFDGGAYDLWSSQGDGAYYGMTPLTQKLQDFLSEKTGCEFLIEDYTSWAASVYLA